MGKPKKTTEDAVEVMLTTAALTSKPPKGDPLYGAISNACARNRWRGTVEELAGLLTKGCSFAPGVFADNTRSNESWVQQQVFALDFDNSKEGDDLTPEDVLERCDELDIRPAFLYPSFSDTTEKRKFRAVFVADGVVNRIPLRKLVQNVLKEIFTFEQGEPDKGCHEPARFFLGTNKPLIHADYDARVNPVQLHAGAKKLLQQQDRSHLARNFERLCSRLGLAAKGSHGYGVCFFCFEEDWDKRFCQPGFVGGDLGESAATSMINSVDAPESPILARKAEDPGFETCFVRWNNAVFSLTFQVQDTDGSKRKVKSQKINLGNSRASNRRDAPRDIRRITEQDWNVLLEKCCLFRSFSENSRRLSHDERLRLFTNLTVLSGGEERCDKGLALRADYARDNTLDSVKLYGYKPQSCSGCRHSEQCGDRNHLINHVPVKRRECRKVRECAPRKPLDVTREELGDAIQHCMDSPEKKVFVIKCDAGVGKTEQMLRQDLDGVCLAFDTHRLKNEVHGRLLAQERSVFLWPDPPKLPKELQKQLDHRYRAGLNGATGIYRDALEHVKVLDNPSWKEQISSYLQALQDIHKESSVITTHEKALQLTGNAKLHTFVFDEDFLKSLIRTDEIRIGDIREVHDKLGKDSGDKVAELLVRFNSVLCSEPGKTHRPAWPKIPKDAASEILAQSLNSIKSPVGALLECSAYRKDSNGPDAPERIYCITRRPLLEDRKHIVLSATADEEVYRRLFGDRLEFIDLSGTELKGRVICHTGRSFAKTGLLTELESFAERVKQDMATHGFPGIITHKCCTEEKDGQTFLLRSGRMVPVIATFGALQGIDAFKGKDLAVYGTPYPPEQIVKLWATLLGIAYTEEDFSFSERVVPWGEYDVSVTTCSESAGLQRLHLWLCNAEIIQAVGRARLVSNDCTVHVYSQLPMSGCELAD